MSLSAFIPMLPSKPSHMSRHAWEQVVRRLRAMERAGLVQRTNETRPTASGRQATVWRAK